jgi:hypothetical protein
MPTERSKLDLIWDRVVELMDDDTASGKIDYRSGGTGRLTANFDGTRYSIYIERVESEEPHDEHD